MNQTTAPVSVSDVLTDIQGITLFLDSIDAEHARDGNAILALQHPALSLRKGEVDVFIVFPHEDEERWNAGWIGGGSFSGTWLEDENGLIVDPWLDERLRSSPNRETSVMQHIPIVMRNRKNDDPLGYLYQPGRPIPIEERQKELHVRYLAWLDEGGMENAVPTRSRSVLGEEGMKQIAPISKWAQAVIAADQHGIPPTRARRQVDDRERRAAPRATAPSDDRTLEERLAAIGSKRTEAEERRRRENQAVAMEAVTKMATKQPLSWKKVLIAILLGLAIGWIVTVMFG